MPSIICAACSACTPRGSKVQLHPIEVRSPPRSLRFSDTADGYENGGGAERLPAQRVERDEDGGAPWRMGGVTATVDMYQPWKSRRRYREHTMRDRGQLNLPDRHGWLVGRQ